MCRVRIVGRALLSCGFLHPKWEQSFLEGYYLIYMFKTSLWLLCGEHILEGEETAEEVSKEPGPESI